MDLPEKPSLDGLEEKWDARWNEAGTYRFDRSKAREQIYSIDTPPPTVSGSLHVGHVCSFTHTDIMARYKRMCGLEVFYPIGWDDNGLPTERRVQNYFGVRCDPEVPHDPDFDAGSFQPSPDPKQRRSIGRRNFIELCGRLTQEDERAFEALFRRLALSVDWRLTYTTIGEVSRRTSQLGFLNLLEAGLAYTAEAPTMWDVDFRTAVAQAEIVDREQDGLYHTISFELEVGGDVKVETSRPELIPACVALVAHPDDDRYRNLVGSKAITPLFGVPVPIVAHPLAEPDKGTGIAMICTFGDITDVTWWRELKLQTRVIVSRDGTISPRAFGGPGWESRDRAAADGAMSQIAGLPVKRARARITELLRDAGSLDGEPKPVRHVVKFYENGERPLEVLTTQQWFVRTLDQRERLLARGRELHWHPPFMRARYESWVENLNSDWGISRQRFFGVPIPVWYPIDPDGNVDHSSPILPDLSSLPIDPQSHVPDGFSEDQRGKPGGFAGDPDVMDTWATSSLTPQIAGGWADDPDLFSRVFPMDLRPQAHEIIRTWLFYTLLRAELGHGSLPWTNAAISGWVLDPERKKMSKSKGNVVTPIEMFERHSSDAVRYWAGSARLGVDTAFDEKQMKVGRRLAIKILNASRFVLSIGTEPGPIAEALDRSLLASLASTVEEATDGFESYEHARALDTTERFFWGFCDDYLELVKQRSYGGSGEEDAASACGALRIGISVLLRLFAPFLPYVTEEVWSWWQPGSIHRSSWPDPEELLHAGAEDPLVYEVASSVLGEVRKAKALSKVSLKTPAERVTVDDLAERLHALGRAESDLLAAGSILKLERIEAEAFRVDTVLASADR
jgi:valyl-tRNA synthetase